MLVAESQTLDRLVTATQVFFAGTALPGLCGLFLVRLGGGARVAALVLGLLSALAGTVWLGWVAWGASTVPGFYLAAGFPLLVGVGTCWLAWRAGKSPTRPPDSALPSERLQPDNPPRRRTRARQAALHPVEDWPFDQAPNVAALTTRQVIEDGLPILNVVHYGEDHSWAFTCGTSDDVADGRIIGMGQALKRDPTLADIAGLPPGWHAQRRAVGQPWVSQPNPDEPAA